MRTIRSRVAAVLGAACLAAPMLVCESRPAGPAGAAAASAPPKSAPAPLAPLASVVPPAAPTAPSAPASSALSAIKTVFLVLMENKTWAEVKGNPDAAFLNREILPQASIAGRYRGALGGTLHPSEPNYIWMEAGDNLGVTDDDDPLANHRRQTDHLVTLLEAAEISWRAYEEDIPGDSCPLTKVGWYRPKHNPMVFFDDVTGGNAPTSARCIEHVRPLTKTPASAKLGDFETDLLTGKVGRYNFITPNMCNDMHTPCPPVGNMIKQGDDWLATWVPRILASPAYRQNGVLFITWDEAESTEQCPGADCPIGMIVLSPLAKGGGYTNDVPYEHGSLLRTVEEIFRVTPYLRAASRATSLSDLFKARAP